MARSTIRAILTLHDQSQIDHINDDDLSAEGHGVARQTCRRDIALAIDALPGKRHARLEFDSHAGEPVVLDITTVGEPDPRAWRHLRSRQPLARQQPAGDATARQRAGGTAGTSVYSSAASVSRFPSRSAPGPSSRVEGYFTEGHTFGAIRAGTISYRLKTRRPNGGRRAIEALERRWPGHHLSYREQ